MKSSQPAPKKDKGGNQVRIHFKREDSPAYWSAIALLARLVVDEIREDREHGMDIHRLDQPVAAVHFPE